jgi:catechol 2,3-dioxygenase-like lactoylglutathione lyase family enzyme
MSRAFRDRLMLLAWVMLLALAFVLRAEAQIVQSVDSVSVTVSDMERSLVFYTRVLPFKRVSGRELAGDDYEHLVGVFGARVRIERLRLGDEYLELMQFLAPAGRSIPEDSRSNDGWFQHVALIVSDMDAAYALLRDHAVRHASTGPQRLPDWNPNAGGIRAFYFRDPDGHALEVLEFPPGKGDPRWQRRDGRLFLGIDHTAITVADTDSSLRFYRDALGLHVAGASENYGPEQERLNNVFGARLRITALRSGSGPGIELLEYLAPRTGRPMPRDTVATDLWHWQVNTRGSVADADQAVRAGHYAYVSPGPVKVDGGGAEALMVRDPDGHALMVQDTTSQ